VLALHAIMYDLPTISERMVAFARRWNVIRCLCIGLKNRRTSSGLEFGTSLCTIPQLGHVRGQVSATCQILTHVRACVERRANEVRSKSYSLTP
jgi:hypothetical protein